jgi:signal transduction histidine kinase
MSLTRPNAVQIQANFSALEDVPLPQLEYLENNLLVQQIPKGDFIFEAGEAALHMIFIWQGHFEAYINQGQQRRGFTNLHKGDITGVLPFSRMMKAGGFGQAQEDSAVLLFPKEKFKELVHNHYELTEALVHQMNSRIRTFTTAQQQNDKMMALGKLSAGLAHELNNPASAIVRSSKALKEHLGHLPEGFKKVLQISISEAAVDEINALMYQRINATKNRLSLMQRQEREDEILDFLEEQQVENADELTENLVEFQFSEADLKLVAELAGAKDFAAIINWVNDNLMTEKMVHDINQASTRIADLVNSVKVFTHMDRAPEKTEADVIDGLENTLTMLAHKVRKGQIEVVKNYQEDLPKAKIFVGQMNQVWTNLIDNAIDALETTTEPQINIDVVQSGSYLRVTVTDNGPGIPAEIQSQIFDPFFTTKAVGKGTGMGLETARNILAKHEGSLTLKSEAGKTEFEACIPLLN